MEVNSYGVNNAERTTGKSKYEQKEDKTQLQINDFMNMLVAQLSNQDVMNPSDSTQFITQMAQFTTLQLMQSMTDLSQAQYAASMVGKKVIVARIDNTGQLQQDQGVVDKVKFVGGQTVFTVNGEDYPLSSIMEVVTEFPKPEEPGTTPKPDEGTTPKPDEGTTPKPEEGSTTGTK